MPTCLRKMGTIVKNQGWLFAAWSNGTMTRTIAVGWKRSTLIVVLAVVASWTAVASGPSVARDRSAGALGLVPSGPDLAATAIGDQRTWSATMLMERYQLSAVEAASQIGHEAWVRHQVSEDRLDRRDGWAGVWIDRKGNGTVVLQSTTVAGVAWLKRQGYPDWVQVRLVAYSAAELHQLRAEIRAALVGLANGQSRNRVEVLESIQYDHVEVYPAKGSAAAVYLQRRYGQDPRVIIIPI